MTFLRPLPGTRAAALVARVARVALVPALVATSVAASVTPAAAAPYATIEGSGSTEAEPLVNQWSADVAPSGLRAIYTAGGTTAGQRDFEQYTTDYAVLDRPQDVSGRQHAAVPLVASGLALAHDLRVDGTRVTGLHLSSAAVVGIFTGTVTRWDDDVIAADNPGLDLPSTPVTPVVRSDGSATTRLLTSWLDHEQPAAWRAFTGGEDSGSFFPSGSRAVRVAGSAALTRRVVGTDGAIGYVPSFFAQEARLPVAEVLNHGGSYVAPGQYAVAIALRAARLDEDGESDLTAVFDERDRRAYPLSSFASAVVPTASNDARMTSAKRQSLVDFLFHASCAGQRKAGPYGYAPLPLPLVRAGLDSLAELGRDPQVDVTGRDVGSCDNPTFDRSDPSRDLLDEVTPYPPACDRKGASVCPSPASPVSVRLAAPVRDGVHVVRPGAAYLVTVRTLTADEPRYHAPVAPGRRLRPTAVLRPAGQEEGVRVWRLWVRPAPTDLRTWRLAVRVGSRATVLDVRRQR